MADPESGSKWWIRYVIVPLIGGGGVVAVIVALIGSSSGPSRIQNSTTTLQSTTASSTGPTNSSPIQPTSADSPPDSRNKESVALFVVNGTNKNTGLVVVPLGTTIEVGWEVTNLGGEDLRLVRMPANVANAPINPGASGSSRASWARVAALSGDTVQLFGSKEFRIDEKTIFYLTSTRHESDGSMTMYAPIGPTLTVDVQ